MKYISDRVNEMRLKRMMSSVDELKEMRSELESNEVYEWKLIEGLNIVIEFIEESMKEFDI